MASLSRRATAAVSRPFPAAQWQQWALVGIAFISALGMRWSLRVSSTADFDVYMRPWVAFLRDGGFAALGQEFANYNVPYLYLLFLGSLLPVEPLSVVKLIALFFDLVMGAGVAAIAYRLRGSVLVAGAGGVAVLLAPEVFLNSAMWGQTDSIWTSLLVWSAYFMVRRNDTLTWVFFALAFAVKLQAGFFVPWMLLAFIMQRHRWRVLLFAAGTFALTYVPALIAGRSLPSLLGIYAGQAGGNVLAVEVPNLYSWVPNQFFAPVNGAAIFLALGIVALLCLLYLRRAPFVPDIESWLLQVAAAVGVLVPFVLPQMHDRYFYAGAVFTMICVLVNRAYLVPAAILQITAVLSYTGMLFLTAPAVPLTLVALAQLVVVSGVVWASVARPQRAPHPII
jgi:Gpi18-like mannosyltransferase